MREGWTEPIFSFGFWTAWGSFQLMFAGPNIKQLLAFDALIWNPDIPVILEDVKTGPLFVARSGCLAEQPSLRGWIYFECLLVAETGGKWWSTIKIEDSLYFWTKPCVLWSKPITDSLHWELYVFYIPIDGDNPASIWLWNPGFDHSITLKARSD